MKRNKIILAIVIIGFLLFGLGYIVNDVRMDMEPYFTEYKLTREEMVILEEDYGVKISPDNWKELEEWRWPNYSHYTIEATEVTENSAKEFTSKAHSFYVTRHVREQFRMRGFTIENPMTAEWVMENPKDAADLASQVEWSY